MDTNQHLTDKPIQPRRRPTRDQMEHVQANAVVAHGHLTLGPELLSLVGRQMMRAAGRSEFVDRDHASAMARSVQSPGVATPMAVDGIMGWLGDYGPVTLDATCEAVKREHRHATAAGVESEALDRMADQAEQQIALAGKTHWQGLLGVA